MMTNSISESPKRRVFILFHHFNAESYGNWDTSVVGIYQSRQRAESELNYQKSLLDPKEQFNTPNENCYSIEEHEVQA